MVDDEEEERQMVRQPLYKCQHGHLQEGNIWFVGQGRGPEGGWLIKTPFCFRCFTKWLTTAFPTELV